MTHHFPNIVTGPGRNTAKARGSNPRTTPALKGRNFPGPPEAGGRILSSPERFHKVNLPSLASGRPEGAYWHHGLIKYKGAGNKSRPSVCPSTSFFYRLRLFQEILDLQPEELQNRGVDSGVETASGNAKSH